MNQEQIRDFNNQTYSVTEGANIIEELNTRTEHGEDGYNSIAELGEKLKTLFESRESRIGKLWHYPANNGQLSVDQEFRGFITPTRYVAGIVLDVVDFDIDDPTKARLLLDQSNEE